MERHPDSVGKRVHCPRCTRPQRACICAWITPVASEIALLILQHPMETDNAKGSARLLHLSVQGSRLVEGEQFDDAVLRDLLYEGGRVPVLLYPDTPGESAPPPFDAKSLATPEMLRLVVLDGTWRKSRKMLYQNPLLQSLPRLPLTAMPASHYLIRKAHAPDQLSTLEATCYALGQLENDDSHYGPLLASFDGFVARFVESSGRLQD